MPLLYQLAIFATQDPRVVLRRSAVLGWQEAVVAQRQHTARRERNSRQRLIRHLRFAVTGNPTTYCQVPVSPIMTGRHIGHVS